MNQLAIPRKIQTLRRTKRHARFTLQCALHASSLAQSTVDSSLIQYVMSCNSGYSRSLSEHSRTIRLFYCAVTHDATVMRTMTSGFLLLLTMMKTMTASVEAVKCIECSSLTDDNCALNAAMVKSECTSSATCFQTYDSSKPGS